MRVLVDTSVWSLALRRQPDALSAEQTKVRGALAELIGDGTAAIIGPIRQEVLSGIRDPATFARLRDRLREFPDEPLTTETFEAAAAAWNQCRARGITGSGVDLLICAVAELQGLAIFTTDPDFAAYQRVLPLRLFRP